MLARMHVGMSVFFQNLRGVSDEEVWLDELKLVDMAEPLGFESVWSVEHHFTDYTMSPDVLQLLTYVAGAHDAGTARLNGGRAALARSGASRGADSSA